MDVDVDVLIDSKFAKKVRRVHRSGLVARSEYVSTIRPQTS